MLGPVLRTQQTVFFTANGEEHDRTFRPGLGARRGFRNRKHLRNAERIVGSTGVCATVGRESERVVVRGKNDRLLRKHRIGPRQHCRHVASLDLLSIDGCNELHVRP